MKEKVIFFAVVALLLAVPAFGAFIDNGDGTVTDAATGLMWQKATAPGTYTWEGALNYCENLVLPAGGYSDWRLPTRNELQSIVDYDVYNPSIDTTFFPGTVASNYWSSTTYAHYTGYAWYVDFYYGNVYYGYVYHTSLDKTSSLYVRAVRSGQCGYFGDSDLDGICDDGDASGVPGDNPCTGGNTVFCDDNCRYTPNADQADANSNGVGDDCICCQCYREVSPAVYVRAGCADNYSLVYDLETTCEEYCLDTCGRDAWETTVDCYCPLWDPEEPAAGCEDNCTLVELVDFSVKAGNGKAIITFETASEIDNAGFNIYRAEESGEYTQINGDLIPAEGTPTEGATYEFVDDGVKNRRTYRYRLEDVDLYGKTTRHEPVSATPRMLYGIVQ